MINNDGGFSGDGVFNNSGVVRGLLCTGDLMGTGL